MYKAVNMSILGDTLDRMTVPCSKTWHEGSEVFKDSVTKSQPFLSGVLDNYGNSYHSYYS